MTRSPRPLLALLLAAACHTPPPPLELAIRQPTVRYRVADDSAARAADRAPLGASVELFAVATPPAGTAVANAAAAIIRDRGMPFRGRSRLPIGTRWLDAAAADRWLAERASLGKSELQTHGDAAAVLDDALTTVVTVADSTIPEVRLHRTAAGVTVALLTPADEHEAREELAIAAPIAAGERAALFVPCAPLGLGGYLLLVHAGGEASADALAAARAEADAARPAAGERQRPQAWQVALTAVGERNRRPALLALYSPHGLPRAIDLLLAADERALIAITDALRPLDPDADELGWRLERSAWRALLPRIERAETPPSMFAAVVRHLGAVADDPSTLDLLLQTSDDEPAFAKGLQEENLAALDDRDTAVRVAADIWLKDKGVVVAAYDPMGDKRARRRALRRHWAKEGR